MEPENLPEGSKMSKRPCLKSSPPPKKKNNNLPKGDVAVRDKAYEGLNKYADTHTHTHFAAYAHLVLKYNTTPF